MINVVVVHDPFTDHYMSTDLIWPGNERIPSIGESVVWSGDDSFIVTLIQTDFGRNTRYIRVVDEITYVAFRAEPPA